MTTIIAARCTAFAYAMAAGFNTYGKLQRGARVIELREGVRAFETWIVQEEGRVIR